MDTKGGMQRGHGDGGVMNWEIGIDTYTLICIKWMTNKNLLYKKISKIKFKNSKKKKKLHVKFNKNCSVHLKKKKNTLPGLPCQSSG